jgi:predicted nucleic-acid-binding Zn-ribbon protein
MRGKASRKEVGLRLQGVTFACTVCQGTRFVQEQVVLKNRDSGLFSTAAAPVATCMICVNCGYVHHFMPQYTDLREGEVDVAGN